MVDYLSGTGAEQERINKELGRDSDEFTILGVAKHKLHIWDCRKKVSKRDVATGSFFIVEHPDYGLIGSSILQYNPLPDAELQYVQNGHNIFPEGFWNERFIDNDISTGSILIGSAYYLEASEYLWSDYIAKEDKIYKSINLTYDSDIVATGSDGAEYTDVVASINGVEYELNSGDNTINNTSTDGIKIKITNNRIEGQVFPITWPISFDEKIPIKINSYKVKYSE